MLSFALQSLWNRRFVACLTIVSIALSVALILGVERLRDSARASFANTASGIDLIVAPRGNDVQILMATVFGVGSTGTGMSWDSYEMVEDLPMVEWTVPLMMGDNHRGSPVIGTSNAYFDHFRHSGGSELIFASGGAFTAADSAVIGAEVAARFAYGVGTVIVNAHGAGDVSFDMHDDAPFTVSGVLEATGTAVDRMVYVSTEGFDRIHAPRKEATVDPFAQATGDPAPQMVEATDEVHDEHAHHDEHDDHGHDEPAEMDHAHEDHDDHAHEDTDHAEEEEHEHAHDGHDAEHQDHDLHDHAPDQINAVYVGLRERSAILGIQRALQTETTEALSAVMPNVALLSLWSITVTAEGALQLMSLAVAAASLIGMVVMLSAALDARRREFAILRSVGAAPRTIFALIITEAMIVTAGGVLLGLATLFSAVAIADPILLSNFGFRMGLSGLASQEAVLLIAVFCFAAVAALLPAWRVYRLTLSDGLTARL